MFTRNGKNNSQFSRNIAKNAALSLPAFVLLGAQVVAAQTGKSKVDPRAMQAHMETTLQPSGSCAPVNGGQILGGFAASADLIDVNSGEICGKR